MSNSSLQGQKNDAETKKTALIGGLLVLCAGLCWSFSGLLVRSAPSLDAWQFLAYRSAGLVLAFFLIDRFNRRPPLLRRMIKLGGLGVICSILMAIAFISYVFALMNTSVANALFLYSCAPILAAIIGYFVLGERLNTGMLVAVLIGLAGLGIMVNGAVGGGKMFGNIMALVPALCFSLYTVIIRLRPDQDFSPSVSGFAYLVILVALVIMLISGDALFPKPFEVLMAFTNGFVSMGAGFALFQLGAQRIPAVSQVLLAQSETLAAPIWVWLFIDERPSLNTLIGGGIILCGVVLMAYAGASQEAQKRAVHA